MCPKTRACMYSQLPYSLEGRRMYITSLPDNELI